MQVSKVFNGSIAAAGSATARVCSYGVTNTITTYQNRADFVNQAIADFLHNDCGVNAAYEVREGSAGKFLWIFNVPFLFAQPSSSYYYFSFWGPFYNTVLNPGSASASAGGSNTVYNGLSGLSLFFENSASSVKYNFTLYFDGDPQKGFILRVKCGTNSISAGFGFMFAKAKNILNSRAAVVWKYAFALAATSNLATYVNGIDFNEDGGMVQESFSNTAISYLPMLYTKAVHKTDSPGKFPLVPLLIGPWKMENMFLMPFQFDLPSAVTSATEMQTATEISGRKFIVTCNNYAYITSSYLNCGLIEVTE